MVDPRHRRPDTPSDVIDPTTAKRAKTVAVAVLVLVVAAGAFGILRYINAGKAVDRWEELARIQRLYDEGGDRRWLQEATPADVASRDEHIRKLEEFLGRNEDDAAIAAHVHARIANLQMTQILGLWAAGGATDLGPRYESAKKHLETLRDRYPDAPINWPRYAPGNAASVTRLALEKLEALRVWESGHGLKSVEPDADPVVVLRTTEGDVRLRFFAGAAPALVKSFLQRVTSGGLDGTLLFQRMDDADEGWVRGGDPRSAKAGATDADHEAWTDGSVGDARIPEASRFAIRHDKGVVSAWSLGDEGDDPLQFVIATKPSPHMNGQSTPFAKVDGDASLSTVERIAAHSTRAQAKPDIRLDPKLSKIADHFVTPVVVRKAIAYEKGAVQAAQDASKLDESEKRLDTLKLDAYRETPPPPPADTPAMDGAGMDGAAMDTAPMDGAGGMDAAGK